MENKIIIPGLAEVLRTAETHNGLPVLHEEQFWKFCQFTTAEGKPPTLDFQGYVRCDGLSYEWPHHWDEGVWYQDILWTNGLKGGIHVGTDGVRSYQGGKWDMQHPDDVKEYTVFVMCPRQGEPNEYYQHMSEIDCSKPGAREKVKTLHQGIVEYIQREEPIQTFDAESKLCDFIYEFDEFLARRQREQN